MRAKNKLLDDQSGTALIRLHHVHGTEGILQIKGHNADHPS